MFCYQLSGCSIFKALQSGRAKVVQSRAGYFVSRSYATNRFFIGSPVALQERSGPGSSAEQPLALDPEQGGPVESRSGSGFGSRPLRPALFRSLRHEAQNSVQFRQLSARTCRSAALYFQLRELFRDF